eukprot:symbB.v1.2.016210.t1/scaffold1231.1/size130510/3
MVGRPVANVSGRPPIPSRNPSWVPTMDEHQAKRHRGGAKAKMTLKLTAFNLCPTLDPKSQAMRPLAFFHWYVDGHGRGTGLSAFSEGLLLDELMNAEAQVTGPFRPESGLGIIFAISQEGLPSLPFV